MSEPTSPSFAPPTDSPAPDAGLSRSPLLSLAGLGRLRALITLTVREALRSRVLLGMTVLLCLFGLASLLWPADLERDRVVLVQRYCFLALTLLGLIAAAFLGGAALPKDISSRRIYALVTKPVSRLELLLGKTLGLMVVLLLFAVLGGLATLAVTHIASARKTYAGGSYAIEVVDETGLGNLKRGQILPARKKEGATYTVTIADRDTSRDIEVPESAVRLHERTLDVLRVAEPDEVRSQCTGKARFVRNELLLTCGEFARNDVWSFDLSGLRMEPGAEDVHVRLRFVGLRYEVAHRRDLHDPPAVALQFQDPAAGHQVRRDLNFVFHTGRAAAPGKRSPGFYEDVLTLPRNLLGGGKLDARVLGYTPVYAVAGRIYYDETKLPIWRIRGFNPRLLPKGPQTIRARFFVHYARGLDLVDHTPVTARITNPVSGQFEDVSLTLRDRTVSFIHFGRHLIDDREGVEIRLARLGGDHLLGHSTRESPVFLLLRPGSFWASTARSAFLVFLQLSLFAALAVAASTFLSAPVAILLTLVFALAGVTKDVLLTLQGAAVSPSLLARQAATVQERLGVWVEHVLRWALRFFAPGFAEFSSTTFIQRGWAVPWSAVYVAAGYALMYIVVSFAFGYAVFRSRELE